MICLSLYIEQMKETFQNNFKFLQKSMEWEMFYYHSSICLSIYYYPSVYFSIYLSIHQFLHHSSNLLIFIFIHLPSIHPSYYPFIHSVHLSSIARIWLLVSSKHQHSDTLNLLMNIIHKIYWLWLFNYSVHFVIPLS